MASMDIDMSLDDMITSTKKSNPRTKRGPKPSKAAPTAPAAGGARARYAGAGGVPQARQAQAAAAIQAGKGGGGGEAYKIIVSNLPLDVDDAAVKDLFDSTIGKTRECSLTYDRNGKHKGVATVVFFAKGDAQKAFKTYNNRLVDGRTPMKVELVFAKPPAPAQTLAARVGAAPAAAAAAAAPAAGRAPKPRRGAKAAAGAAGGPKPDGGRRPAKSQADLDAEMDSWKSSSETAPATADAAVSAAPAAEATL